MRLLLPILPLLALLSPLALDADLVPIPEGKPICTRPFSREPITYSFSSTYADIAVWDSGGTGRPVIFIHGNSCCKEVFTHQFHSELPGQYRLIALDLPGHGQSSKARDPKKGYCIDGHSQIVIELIEKLHLESPFLVGGLWAAMSHWMF